MRRRALLSLLGVAVAGCTEGGNDATPRKESTSQTTVSSTSDTTATTTEPPTRTRRETDAELAEPLDVGVPPGESDCPSDGDLDRLVCIPETDPDSVPISLTGQPESGTISLPASLRFGLVNDTEGTFQTNPYDWRLWKRVDGQWHVVAPDVVPDPLLLMPPGGSHGWTLTLEHSLPASPDSGYYGAWDASGTVEGIGGGEYAFTTGGWFDTAEGTQDLGFGVRFTVDAPQTTLEPTDAVTEISRDGDTVTVRGESIPPEGPPVRTTEYVLVRDESDAESRRLLPEVAARDRMLRNTLSYVEEGVREVRYLERNRGLDSRFGLTPRFTYEDDRFESTVTDGATETPTD